MMNHSQEALRAKERGSESPEMDQCVRIKYSLSLRSQQCMWGSENEIWNL